MKATFIIETSTKEQMEILLRFLKEMGIGIIPADAESGENADWENLSVREMEKEWKQPANTHWDKFLQKALKK